ncbi:hypothetical protein PG994_004204 [Apiospora phragmitis]|uniref:Uncharacterized protein n=1 Tax=Apiospora phragmitis TaxID=2905665 RepID=A0ABR1VPY0_9PEZI
MGWLGENNKLEQLRSLAEALHLSIILPTTKAKKAELLCFCKAASTPQGSQSLAALYDVQSFYGGAGGHVCPHSSEDVSSYPPSKRRDCGAVEKGEAACAATEAVAEAVPEAVDLFSHPPLLRPLLLLLEAQVRKTDKLTDELDGLRKSHAELEGELSRLRENHGEVEAQVAATNDRHESPEGRTYVLEEGYEEVRKQLPDIRCEVEDAVRALVGDELR